MVALDGWPLAPLPSLPQRLVSADQFRRAVGGCLKSEDSTGAVLRMRVDDGGSDRLDHRPLPPPSHAASRQFLAEWSRDVRYTWGPDHLVLIDRPCYVVVETGVVLLEDGRIIPETIYPSTLEDTIERQVGSGLREETLASALLTAPLLDRGACAPLLARWSSVYFHAVTESMVHDAALAWAGLSPLIRYLVPARPFPDCRQIAIDEASSRLARCGATVVKVPSVVFSTVLYKHASFGRSLRRFVERARREASATAEASAKAAEKIYVSRVGAGARPMRNEGALISALERAGFSIFAAEGLSFRRQVQAFLRASLVVGPHGSGLVNAAFAAPGATLFELRPLNAHQRSPLWDQAYRRMCAALGLSYCAHVSANAEDSDPWEANIAEILDAIAVLDPAASRQRTDTSA